MPTQNATDKIFFRIIVKKRYFRQTKAERVQNQQICTKRRKILPGVTGNKE